jgi:hypothetical protein
VGRSFSGTVDDGVDDTDCTLIACAVGRSSDGIEAHIFLDIGCQAGDGFPNTIRVLC